MKYVQEISKRKINEEVKKPFFKFTYRNEKKCINRRNGSKKINEAYLKEASDISSWYLLVSHGFVLSQIINRNYK